MKSWNKLSKEFQCDEVKPYYEALKKKMQQRTTFGDLKNCIRSSLEPFLFQKTNRNPIVIPVILNQKAAMEEIQQKTSK